MCYRTSRPCLTVKRKYEEAVDSVKKNATNASDELVAQTSNATMTRREIAMEHYLNKNIIGPSVARLGVWTDHAGSIGPSIR